MEHSSCAAYDAGEITLLLRNVKSGKEAPVGALVLALYQELRSMARRHLNGERKNHTLQATAIIHEVYCKLLRQDRMNWRDRKHFFGAASRMIRRILIDHARGKNRLRRGAGVQPVTVDGLEVARHAPALDLVELDDALQRLAAIRKVQARIVELRFFGGLTMDEIAGILGMGRRSVDREWQAARGWLHQELSHGSCA